MKTQRTFLTLLLALAGAAMLAGCSTPAAPSGYGLAAARNTPPPEPEAPANTPATYLQLIQQMQQNGLWFASLAHIDAFEQQNGVSPETLMLRGDALRQTGQQEASSKIYLRLMGTSAEAAGYRGLGLVAGSQGDFARAVEMLEKAQRRNPTDALALSDLAYAYMRDGRLAQARVPVMQASQLQPELAKVQGNLALFLLAVGQQEQARALMDRHNMTPVLRAAIEREALLVNPALSAAGTGAVADSSPLPLSLKTSSWLSN